MKKMFNLIGVAACVLATVLFVGCASNQMNSKTSHTFQAAGKGIKFGVVQDPVTGQYSFGYQSIFAGAMIIPIMAVQDTNGAPVITTPDAVMSYEIGGKETFFGSASSTVTFAVGPNAVQTMLGGQHQPINETYQANSATGLSTALPLTGSPVPTVTTATIQTLTGTNGISQSLTNIVTTPIIIKP